MYEDMWKKCAHCGEVAYIHPSNGLCDFCEQLPEYISGREEEAGTDRQTDGGGLDGWRDKNQAQPIE